MKARIKFANTCRVYFAGFPGATNYDLIMEYVEELRNEAYWSELLKR